MRFLYQLSGLFRSLFRSRDVDADIAEEMRFHLEKETEANVARGLTRSGAYRAARLAMGSVDDAQERSRDERPGARLRQFARDVSFGARLLAKSPAFGVAGIAIVALGIGAVTAIFSVVYGVMLRPLPFRQPDRLITVWTTTLSSQIPRLYPNAADFTEWKRSNRSFEDLALIRTTANLNLVGGGEPERLQGARFSSNLLSVLGVSPALGRGFAADEDQPGHDQVVLLSDGLWRQRFGADPSVVGRAIQLNGLPYAVIGVMPPEFQYPTRDYQAFVPLVIDPRELARQVTQNYIAVGRLRSGVTLEQAGADMAAIAQRLERETPATNRDHRILLEPMLENAVKDVRAPLAVLLAAACCLLFIACLNLSNLLGARAASRAGEYSVRLALGATRGRLVAQAIAEVLPVLVLGGAFGVLVANLGVNAFVASAPPNVPRLESVAVSLPVILIAIAVLAMTGVIASVMPAVQAWRSDFTSMTRDGGRSSTAGLGRARARRFGVAAQIAFAVPLLVGASLLIRSSLRLADVDLGFDPNHVASFHIAVSRTQHPTDRQVAAFYEQLVQRVRAVPGVRHAGMVNRLPLYGNQTMAVEGERAAGSVAEESAVDSRPVTPDYFAAMGIALRSGRTFTEHDDSAGVRVAIVDERLAGVMWPGQDAIGKRIRFTGGDWATVVGVAAHIRTMSVDDDPRPQIYWSYAQVTQDRMALVVRGAGDAGALIRPVIDAIHSLDADQPVYDVRPMDAVVDRSLVRRRLTMVLIASFGAIALALAAVGVYGVIAYGVTQRLREFGIRIALGAERSAVTALVVRQGLRLAVLGTVLGLVPALLLGGAMSSLVYETDPRDPLALITAASVLVGVAALASYFPARRAAAVDPSIALRSE